VWLPADAVAAQPSLRGRGGRLPDYCFRILRWLVPPVEVSELVVESVLEPLLDRFEDVVPEAVVFDVCELVDCPEVLPFEVPLLLMLVRFEPLVPLYELEPLMLPEPLVPLEALVPFLLPDVPLVPFEELELVMLPDVPLMLPEPLMLPVPLVSL
jgi:hypothetical protein